MPLTWSNRREDISLDSSADKTWDSWSQEWVEATREWAPKKEKKKHKTGNDGRTQIPFAKSFHVVRIYHFEPVTYALHIEKQRRILSRGRGAFD